jgi:hypothetical protein
MERHNVTVSLPAEILKQARHLAVERGTSLSWLLASCLEELVRNEPAYQQAKERAVARMRQGLAMAVGKRPSWTRDEIHER